MIQTFKNKFKISEKINEGIQCNLCPHFCFMKNGQIGKCNARKNRDGESHHIYLGAISALAIEPIEKKPFKNFLQGSKTLTYGNFGCNLSCLYCLPPDSLISTPKGVKRIDKIEDEEEIFALDNSNNDPQLVLAHVGHVFDREAEEVIVIEVDGGKLELTPEHPVMTKNRGWVKAEYLTSDDEVLCDKTCL